ncbi:MurR/RpiR family transcriptional regulator [Clostridium omnivorum]|uniref:HTH rpiR-type domain-containing protein n=1 Tax=Clostridium omnivorum TaxID=1604902 RepID=A0ABQ5N9N4_9CLOT|nr:SIS domain-containing protein [Clostridium sp. E14]GLC31809.1 hypothetical protein bsdE14_32190 [Clostridium sp. E14]
MINVNINKLNPLEMQIYEKLQAFSKDNPPITINQAAEVCECSVSKISKFVKKLGFNNYKQYIDFLYGKEIVHKKPYEELERLKKFIDDFDEAIVDEFIEIMNSHEKIVFFGYGPSFICTQYFEYKLRMATNKFVIAVQDEISAENLLDENSLLVIFSATGKFRSFEEIHNFSKEKKNDILLIVEEYNAELLSSFDKIFWLSKYPQPEDLKPYEKSRTVFFIFIEEVIQRIISNNKQEKINQQNQLEAEKE